MKFPSLTDNRVFWVLTIVFAAIALLLVVIAGIYVDTDSASKLSAAVKQFVDSAGLGGVITELDILVRNDAVAGALVAALSSAITVATMQLTKVHNMRKMAVEALAFGYYDNFIKRLISHCYETYEHFRILIILPSYELINQPDFYWGELKRFLSREGFELKDTRSDTAFARNAFFIQKKEIPNDLPLFVDVPTTTRALSKVLELEADTPIGTLADVKWARKRFSVLIGHFINAMENYITPESFGNVKFVISKDASEFTTKIAAEIDELEAELLQSMGDSET